MNIPNAKSAETEAILNYTILRKKCKTKLEEVLKERILKAINDGYFSVNISNFHNFVYFRCDYGIEVLKEICNELRSKGYKVQEIYRITGAELTISWKKEE